MGRSQVKIGAPPQHCVHGTGVHCVLCCVTWGGSGERLAPGVWTCCEEEEAGCSVLSLSVSSGPLPSIYPTILSAISHLLLHIMLIKTNTHKKTFLIKVFNENVVSALREKREGSMFYNLYYATVSWFPSRLIVTFASYQSTSTPTS